MVIITKALEFDDRLVKQCRYLKDMGADVEIVAFEGDHPHGRQGMLPCGVEFKTLSDLSRYYFKPGKGIYAKGMETMLRLILQAPRLRDGIVWAHDPAMRPFVAWAMVLRSLGYVRRVIWDLHELPPGLATKQRRRDRVRRLAIGVDLLIVTNEWRRKYMEEMLHVDLSKAAIVENYASSDVQELEVRPLPDDLQAWLRGRPYLLAQGGAGSDRHYQCLAHASVETGIPLVVVGKNGQVLDSDLIYNCGWLPQSEVFKYIDHALASVILYNTDDPNAKFCSPNRLYQALDRGCPVIVGNNPPLRAVVLETGAGVVLNSDGRDVEDIKLGIGLFMGNSAAFKERACNSIGKYVWREQLGVVDTLFEL